MKALAFSQSQNEMKLKYFIGLNISLYMVNALIPKFNGYLNNNITLVDFPEIYISLNYIIFTIFYTVILWKKHINNLLGERNKITLKNMMRKNFFSPVCRRPPRVYCYLITFKCDDGNSIKSSDNIQVFHLKELDYLVANKTHWGLIFSDFRDREKERRKEPLKTMPMRKICLESLPKFVRWLINQVDDWNLFKKFSSISSISHLFLRDGAIYDY